MDQLLIKGPASLSGTVRISRAKNACLPIMTAVLLNPNPVHLLDLPDLRDIRTMKKLLSNLGVKITSNGNRTTFDSSEITSFEATYDLVKTMRASIYVLGPLLARFKQAKVSLPGGCAIGPRPIDIHLDNLMHLNAQIELSGGYVEAKTEGLKGDKLILSFPSVGATANLLMASVLAQGTTIIENPALEPEIDDLANFLVKMGGKIDGIGTTKLTVEGIEDPSRLLEIEYTPIGDRIEAATYIMAALITKSSIKVSDINPGHLDSVLATLREMGAKISVGPDYVETAPSELKGVTVDTAPYPGFPTDVQAQLTALATIAKGTSIITENIFENRFMHIPELSRMGAKITLKGKSAVVDGGGSLNSAPVMCTDLRASAALIVAALAAEGETQIQRVYHLDRGYENLDEKLTKLGVSIERIRS